MLFCMRIGLKVHERTKASRREEKGKVKKVYRQLCGKRAASKTPRSSTSLPLLLGGGPFSHAPRDARVSFSSFRKKYRPVSGGNTHPPCPFGQPWRCCLEQRFDPVAFGCLISIRGSSSVDSSSVQLLVVCHDRW